MEWEEGTRHRQCYLKRYVMGDEDRDWGEHEAVSGCRGGERTVDCGATLGLRSVDHVEGREEGDGVNAEEEAFVTYAMGYRGAYNRAVDRLRHNSNLTRRLEVASGTAFEEEGLEKVVDEDGELDED